MEAQKLKSKIIKAAMEHAEWYGQVEYCNGAPTPV